jgi:hypothetical protein
MNMRTTDGRALRPAEGSDVAGSGMLLARED